MVWSQGEFTGDGTVDINDLTIVLAHYNADWRRATGIPPVPEPASAPAGRRAGRPAGLRLAEAKVASAILSPSGEWLASGQSRNPTSCCSRPPPSPEAEGIVRRRRKILEEKAAAGGKFSQQKQKRLNIARQSTTGFQCSRHTPCATNCG